MSGCSACPRMRRSVPGWLQPARLPRNTCSSATSARYAISVAPTSEPSRQCCSHGAWSLRRCRKTIGCPSWGTCCGNQPTSPAAHTSARAELSPLTLPGSISTCCLCSITIIPLQGTLGPTLLHSGCRRCSTGGSACMTTHACARRCAAIADARCGPCSSRRCTCNRQARVTIRARCYVISVQTHAVGPPI